MEGEVSRLEIHTPVFHKKKKKRKDPAYKEKHRRHSHGSFGDSPLASEQPDKRKGKKKRKDFRDLVSSREQSEICDETEKATSTARKSKKRRNSALGAEDETGVVYVVVDKENIENMPKNFRKDVDVVYVDMSKEQKSAKEPEADAVCSVAKRRKTESEELHNNVREKKKKKKKKRRLEAEAAAASWDPGQGGPSAHIALPQPESHPPEALLPEGLGGEVTRSPGSAHKKKSKKKKRKFSSDQEREALAVPESLESMNLDGSHVVGESGTIGGRKEAGRAKKRAKKRRRKSSAESAPVTDADLSALNSGFGDPPLGSFEGSGTLIEESAEPRPPEEKGQECSDEVPSLEPANEESNLESAKESGTKYLSEDSRESDDPDVDLDSAVRQLQEFIPGIKERAATTIKRMYRDDLGRFKEFKAQGVAIRFGKFSAKENKQLEKNVQEFLSLTGIESADKLLYTDRYPEEKAAITDLKRKYAFRLHIGKWRAVHSDQPQPSALKRETCGKYLAQRLARCALTAAVANRILTGSLRFRGLGMCSCLPHVELYRF